jgi:hypothetical protein
MVMMRVWRVLSCMWGLMIVVSHRSNTIGAWAASDTTVVESEFVITLLHHAAAVDPLRSNPLSDSSNSTAEGSRVLHSLIAIKNISISLSSSSAAANITVDSVYECIIYVEYIPDHSYVLSQLGGGGGRRSLKMEARIEDNKKEAPFRAAAGSNDDDVDHHYHFYVALFAADTRVIILPQVTYITEEEDIDEDKNKNSNNNNNFHSNSHHRRYMMIVRARLADPGRYGLYTQLEWPSSWPHAKDCKDYMEVVNQQLEVVKRSSSSSSLSSQKKIALQLYTKYNYVIDSSPVLEVVALLSRGGDRNNSNNNYQGNDKDNRNKRGNNSIVLPVNQQRICSAGEAFRGRLVMDAAIDISGDSSSDSTHLALQGLLPPNATGR